MEPSCDFGLGGTGRRSDMTRIESIGIGLLAVLWTTGCPSGRSASPAVPSTPETPSCWIQLQRAVIMTNPPTPNPQPTLSAQLVGFPRHSHYTYSWTIANSNAGGRIIGSGESITFDTTSIVPNGRADVVLTVAGDDGTSASCDYMISQPDTHSAR